jgi:hypothetical protein
LVDDWLSMLDSYGASKVDLVIQRPEGDILIIGTRARRCVEDFAKYHGDPYFVRGGQVQLSKLWLEGAGVGDLGETAIATAIQCLRMEGSESIRMRGWRISVRDTVFG